MLNPALLAAISACSALEYKRVCKGVMPWPLIHLIAPLVLHRGTRQALPKDTRSHLATWVSKNPAVVAGFPARAQSLVGPVREGLRFGLAVGALRVDEDGGLTGVLAKMPSAGSSDDGSEIVMKAGLVGRWLTKVDQPGTAFILLGVAP